MADKPRFAVYEYIIYPDSKTYNANTIIRKIISDVSNYAYILHDKDVYTKEEIEDSDGELSEDLIGTQKKPHYHLIIQLENGRYYSGMLRDNPLFNHNTLLPFTNWKRRVRYLVHADDKNKHKYELSEVVHYETDEEFKQYFEDKESQEQRIIQLAKHCKEFCGESSYETLMWTLANHLWGDYKQNQLMFRDIKNEERMLTKHEHQRQEYY